MSATFIAIFAGNSAASGPVVVNGPGGGGSPVPNVVAGDRIVEVINIASGADLTADFASIAPANGTIVQMSGVLGSVVCLAVISRG